MANAEDFVPGRPKERTGTVGSEYGVDWKTWLAGVLSQRRRDFLSQKSSFAANCRSLGAAALTTYPNSLLSVMLPLIA